MKIGRVGLMIILMGLTLSIFSYADEIRIPFSIKQDMFVNEMAKHGMDLKKSDDSEGFTEFDGKGFHVITYKPVTQKQLDLIKDISWKCLRK